MKDIAVRAAALVTQLAALGPRDAAAYTAVMAAYKLSGDTPDAASAKKLTVDEALLGAAEVPLETARACVKVLDLTVAVAQRGNTNAISDAGVAALMAEAACKGAVYNVRINVSALEDKSKGARLVEECGRLLKETSERVQTVMASVETAIG